MKLKASVLVLAVGLAGLVVAVIVLSRVFFGVEVEPQIAKAPPAPAKPMVTETIIDANGMESVKARPARKVAPAPVQPSAQEDSVNPATEAAVAQEGIGTVRSIKGIVSATSADGKIRQLAKNDRVFINERVETGPGGRIEIKLDDESVITQGESSACVIDDYAYEPARPKECGLTMRLVKGACRVVTGLITKTNPDRFRVRTKMATVGIRGCDLAFKSTLEKDDIYVLDLAGEKNVIISSAVNGSPLLDQATGKEITLAANEMKSIDVNEPNTAVSVMPGRGMSEPRKLTSEEAREVKAETSYLPPAQHDLLQAPDGATFKIRPREGSAPAGKPTAL